MRYVPQLKSHGIYVVDGQGAFYSSKGVMHRSYICAYTTTEVCQRILPHMKAKGMCYLVQAWEASSGLYASCSCCNKQRVNVSWVNGQVIRYLHETIDMLRFPCGTDVYIVIWNRKWPWPFTIRPQGVNVENKVLSILNKTRDACCFFH